MSYTEKMGLSMVSNHSVLAFDSYATTKAASETASAKFTVTSSMIGASRSTGTLTGSLLAFGIAALRGIECIVMHGRLVVLRSHFPHDNNANSQILAYIYKDILELISKYRVTSDHNWWYLTV
jgi:hypothetical protein